MGETQGRQGRRRCESFGLDAPLVVVVFNSCSCSFVRLRAATDSKQDEEVYDGPRLIIFVAGGVTFPEVSIIVFVA